MADLVHYRLPFVEPTAQQPFGRAACGLVLEGTEAIEAWHWAWTNTGVRNTPPNVEAITCVGCCALVAQQVLSGDWTP